MRFLNLDLDFFLDGVAHYRRDEERLSSTEFSPWEEQEVRAFLENKCGLSIHRQLPGRVVEHHDEAFDFWLALVTSGQVDVPFEVVHIDAHADLGLGDTGHIYVMSTLLHWRPEDRPQLVDRSRIEFGNYLTFAIACRWISKLVYVTHPKSGDDLHPYHFKDYDKTSGLIQLKKLATDAFDNPAGPFSVKSLPVLEFEPEVPFEAADGRTFRAADTFDFMILSRSPGFTPVESDRLIPVIQQYIDPI